MNGIGRGKRRFSTDENYNFYDDDAFPSSPTIETISEDLNEMKIKILSKRYEIIPTQVFKYVKRGKKTLFFIPKEVTSYKICILVE